MISLGAISKETSSIARTAASLRDRGGNSRVTFSIRISGLTLSGVTENSLCMEKTSRVLAGSPSAPLLAAFRRGSASELASFDYATIVWSLLIAWAIWAEVTNLASMAGALLIAASGIAMAKTRQRARERREDQPIKPSDDVPRAAVVEMPPRRPDNRSIRRAMPA